MSNCSRPACASAVGGIAFESPLSGRHGVMNLLAGIAVAGVFGIEPEAPARARSGTLAPGKMRGRAHRA